MFTRIYTRTVIVFILFISIMVFFVSGCYYDKAQYLYPSTISCSGINAKFNTDVKPIILNKCATAGCHDASTAAGGTILETYVQISAKAARINQRCIVDKTMPPGKPLIASEIAVLSCWISSGSVNN